MATIIKEPLRALGLEGLFTWAKEVVKRPVLDGRIIDDIVTTTSGTIVDHGLDRVPRGVIIIKCDAYDFYTIDTFTKQSLTISGKTGGTIVSVWVF